MDPRQQDIVRSVVGHDEDVTLRFSGGVEGAERRRLLLIPPYQEADFTDFALQAFELAYPQKFATLSHPQLLGALLNLGIKREKFGDFLFHNEGDIQVMVACEIAEYVKLNLTNVGKTPVQLHEMAIDDLEPAAEDWREQVKTVSSLRLDVVAAVIYQQSRAKMAALIKKGYVKVNWKVVEQPSFLLQGGDYLSVRHLGRSKLISIEGRTKKDKYRIMTGLIHHH